MMMMMMMNLMCDIFVGAEPPRTKINNEMLASRYIGLFVLRWHTNSHGGEF
jgi:hypothetical protein